jgi:chemotaxis protein methyltransferase CheR
MLTQNEFEEIKLCIKQYTLFDFTDYAEGSLQRRINRLMINQKLDFNQLKQSIMTSKSFANNMMEEITVNTTELFRDPEVWTFLRTNTFTNLRKRKTINIWISGCSTGQEAYSMAILLHELGLADKARIFATDINTKVLDVAKKGEYRFRNNLDYISNFDKVIRHNPLNFDDVHHVDHDKYFQIDKVKDKIIMNDFLKKKIIFLQNDLVKKPKLDFANFDLISCRNVLIYHNQKLQTRIIEGFYNNLHPDSYLLLGVHESILGSNASKFKKRGKLFLKQ